MKYSEPLRNQLNVFLVFLGVGFLLGFLYEVLLFLQSLLSVKKAAVLTRDLLFCFVSFTALFCAFLGYTNGVWRLPLLLSCAAGFFVFEQSLGKYLRTLLSVVSSAVTRLAQILLKPFSFAAGRLRQKAKGQKAVWNLRLRATKEKAGRFFAGKRRKKPKRRGKRQKNVGEIENKT